MARKMPLIAVLLLITVSFSTAQQRRSIISLMDLNCTGISQPEALILTDQLMADLINTGKYDVIDRANRNEILKEQAFSLTGACNEASCLIEVGKYLSVEKMVGGTVGKFGNTWTINIRMVNVSTGAIEKVAVQKFKGEPDALLDKMNLIAVELAQSGVMSLQQLAQAETKARMEEARQKADKEKTAEAEAQARRLESEEQRKADEQRLAAELARKQEAIKKKAQIGSFEAFLATNPDAGQIVDMAGQKAEWSNDLFQSFIDIKPTAWQMAFAAYRVPAWKTPLFDKFVQANPKPFVIKKAHDLLPEWQAGLKQRFSAQLEEASLSQEELEKNRIAEEQRKAALLKAQEEEAAREQAEEDAKNRLKWPKLTWSITSGTIIMIGSCAYTWLKASSTYDEYNNATEPTIAANLREKTKTYDLIKITSASLGMLGIASSVWLYRQHNESEGKRLFNQKSNGRLLNIGYNHLTNDFSIAFSGEF